MISKSQIKFVKSLQQKKYRDINKCFVVESSKNVNEIMDSDYEILHLFATKKWLELNEREINVSVNEVNEKELQRITSLKTASDILAVVKMPQKDIEFDFEGVNIVLDEIKDPGNLGTIIRICDWFGVKNIYCSDNSVDVYNSKVVQSTMGSISRVNVIYTNLRDMISNLDSNTNVYAAVMDGEDVNKVEISTNSLIVFGNESSGVSDEINKLISNKITINKIGEAESLNIAVSSAIILNQFCN